MLLDMRMTLGGRFARKPLADAIIYALFANGEEGAVYCPYDLTDEKLAWRRNLLLWSEDFSNTASWQKQNGIIVETTALVSDSGATFSRLRGSTTATSDVQQRITNQSLPFQNPVQQEIWYSWTVKNVNTNGFRCFLFDGVTRRGQVVYSFETNSITVGAQFVVALTVVGDEVTLVARGTCTAGIIQTYLNPNIEDAWNDPTVEMLATKAVVALPNQVEPYQKITDFNTDFMAAFPNHTLFQNHLGTIPVTGHSQPIGKVLDKRLGGFRGENLYTGPAEFSVIGNAPSGVTVQAGVTYEVSYKVLSNPNEGSGGFTSPSAANFGVPLSDTRIVSGSARFIGKAIATQEVQFFMGVAAGEPIVFGDVTFKPILGNHAHQPLSAARPLWQNNGGLKSFWFDGFDDHLVTVNTMDLSGTSEVSVFAGVMKEGDKTVSALLEFTSNSTTSSGSFGIFAPLTERHYQFRQKGLGSTVYNDFEGIPELGSGYPHALSSNSSLLAGGQLTARVNNEIRNHSPNLNGGNYTNDYLYIGARAGDSFYFQGHIYSLIIRSTLTPENQASKIQQLLATRSGVTL